VPVIVGVGLVVAFVWTMLVGSYDQFAAVLIAMALLLLTIPLARHAARVEAWPGLAWLVMAASALRLVGALARYLVAYGVYSGVADASTYTAAAKQHYQAFRHFHFFWPNTGVDHGLIPWLDTIIYAIAGPTELGAFLVFSWISLVGAYLFFRAFRIGYPRGDGRRYALLVFFIPSMLYWPSSLGKESWMVFAIGLASYGVARAIAGRAGGYLSLVAGVGAMLLIRPHLALIFLPAAAIAFVLRRTTPGRRRPIGRLVGIAVLVVSSLAVVAKAQSYFGITSLDVQTVTKQLNTTRQQTAIGNSAFNPPNARSPVGFPEATATVLFRPFPWEAHSLTVGVASLEGVILLGLTLTSWRRLRQLPRALWQDAYVTYALTYCALFVLAFSNFANFGILARQRVQMLPLFLVLLSIPAEGQEGTAGEDNTPVGSQSELVSGAARRGSPETRGPSLQPKRKLRPYGTARQRGPVLAYSARRRVVNSPLRPLAAGSYQALDYAFRVEVVGAPGADALREQVVWALSDLAAAPTDDHIYRLRVQPDDGRVSAVLERDGAIIGGPAPPGRSVAELVSEVSSQAIASRPNSLLLHAAALSVDGQGLLIPGATGSGKSTLAAALVLAGFDYLTDEAAAVDLETLEIAPYPKPISLRTSAAQLLGPALPAPPGSDFPDLVPCSRLRPHSCSPQVRARLLLFPRYEVGARTELIRMSRAEALIELTTHSFNFVEHGGQWMVPLRRLIMQCWCGRLTAGDLDGVPAAIRRLSDLQGGINT
jgi:hypothetical protein